MKAKVKIVDVFTITGRGNVLAASILEGMLNTGDTIILGNIKRIIKGVEMFTSFPPNNVGLQIGSEDKKEDLFKFKDQEVEIE